MRRKPKLPWYHSNCAVAPLDSLTRKTPKATDFTPGAHRRPSPRAPYRLAPTGGSLKGRKRLLLLLIAFNGFIIPLQKAKVKPYKVTPPLKMAISR